MKGIGKLLLFFGIAIILVILYVFLIHSKTSKEIAGLKDTYSMVSDSLNKAKQIANRLPETQKEYNFLKKQWVLAQGMLPMEKVTEQLLSIISKSATENNVKIISFKPGKLKTEKNFQAYPLSIKLLGGYHNTGRFFSDIGNLKRIIRVGDINMEWKKEKEWIETTFTASSYLYAGIRERERTPVAKKGGNK